MTDEYLIAAWRLIVSGKGDGATNMAVDEAIAEAVAGGRVLPTLRFYGWEPGCVSLGRSQSAETINQTVCKEKGFDLVRRATGGRAILHVDELTYSVAARRSEPRVAGGVLESYRRLSAGLVCGLERFGLVVEQAPLQKMHKMETGAVCFDVPSDYEITVGGRKLVGSAQLRAGEAILQHGAIPLRGDIARLVEVLDLSAAARAAEQERVRERALTVKDAVGREAHEEELMAALVRGFGEALRLNFVREELTGWEIARSAEIRTQKYANRGWTFRR